MKPMPQLLPFRSCYLSFPGNSGPGLFNAMG